MAKANNIEVDSNDFGRANVDKKWQWRHGRRGAQQILIKNATKGPKKKNMSRKKIALYKKKEEDFGKQETKRNIGKKAVVSNTIAAEVDWEETAVVPVQQDN